ncbi:MAG TPA: hypothetical protein VF266_04055, partial [Thermoanaerobaculia bacterium]
MRKAVSLLGLLAALSVHAASSPQLVFDINTTGDVRGSAPSWFFSAGRVAYFFADDGGGRALWTTDGTASGTRMVAELPRGGSPYFSSRFDEGFVASGDLVWFWFEDDVNDGQLSLWRTDGTRGGTFPVVRDLGYTPIDLAPIGARGVIARTSDRFLSSDGTVEGTRFLEGDSFAQQLVAFRGLVYFISDYELWRTDGTDAGTTRVGGFDDDFDDVEQLVAGDDAIYIVADSRSSWELHHLWRSDGTQPRLVETYRRNPGDEPRLVASNGTVYALMGGGEGLTELWRAGPQPARVTVLEANVETYMFLGASGGSIYFETRNPNKLWRSDGTAAGTRVFEGIDITDMLFLAGSRVFAFSGAGVHVSDGTRATLVTPFEADTYDSVAAVIGDLVVFTVDDETHGSEPWVSDGTPQGTRLLKNIRADGGSEGAHLRRLGDALLFRADSERHGVEPWITDGTLFGTRLLADVAGGSGSSMPALFTPLANGRAVFLAAGRLYATDGNLTEMLRQADVYLGDDAHATQLPVIGGRAWIVYGGSNETDEVWTTDGTRGGTTKLVDIPYRDDDFTPVAANGVLFFVARGSLWRTDGTEQGTFAVASHPEQMHVAGNRLFFLSRTAAHGRELWVTDGTLGGTHIVKDIHRGEEDAFPYEFPWDEYLVTMRSAGDLLFFTADDGVHGLEPWRSDGTEAGTFLLHDVAPGEASSMLPMFERDSTAFADGSIFFAADDGVHGVELWRSDLQQTTELVRDIVRGQASSTPTNLRVIGDLVTFSANDGRHGRELWWASPANAGLLADVNPGPDSSLPREMTELNGFIYFFASAENRGDELWRVGP